MGSGDDPLVGDEHSPAEGLEPGRALTSLPQRDDARLPRVLVHQGLGAAHNALAAVRLAADLKRNIRVKSP